MTWIIGTVYIFGIFFVYFSIILLENANIIKKYFEYEPDKIFFALLCILWPIVLPILGAGKFVILLFKSLNKLAKYTVEKLS